MPGYRSSLLKSRIEAERANRTASSAPHKTEDGSAQVAALAPCPTQMARAGSGRSAR